MAPPLVSQLVGNDRPRILPSQTGEKSIIDDHETRERHEAEHGLGERAGCGDDLKRAQIEIPKGLLQELQGIADVTEKRLLVVHEVTRPTIDR